MKNHRYSLKELVAESSKNKFSHNDLVIDPDLWGDEELSLFDVVTLSNINLLAKKLGGSIVTTKRSFISLIANFMGCSKKSAERFLCRMLDSEQILIVSDENADNQGFVRYITANLASCFYEYLTEHDDVDLEPWMQAYLDLPIPEVLAILNGGN